jgi:hypothetical protein
MTPEPRVTRARAIEAMRSHARSFDGRDPSYVDDILTALTMVRLLSSMTDLEYVSVLSRKINEGSTT